MEALEVQDWLQDLNKDGIKQCSVQPPKTALVGE
jgi:hypothetical protein